MNYPKIITSNRIITEWHKGIDLVKLFHWHRVREFSYKGIRYIEVVK